MPPADDDVDDLYSRPLKEFTAARNTLAKQAGPRGAAIRQLEKPTVPAWAVNQLYWQRRKTYDRLVDAAAHLRSAHRQLLSGKRAELASVEAAHRDALKAATDDVRRILEDAGEAASPATRRAVADTLQALPAAGPPGRLTRPLQPPGLEALAGIDTRGGGLARRLPARGPTPPTGSRSAAQRAATDARRDALARKRRRARLERDTRAARGAAAAASGALKKARQRLVNAEGKRAQLAVRLDHAAEQVEHRRTEMARLDFEARRAAAERDRLEAALREDRE